MKRPQYFGTLTNDIVWKRLAPGVLTELKKVLPKDEKGHRRGTFVQALTRNVGYPKLRELLGAVVAYMSVSNDYKDFVEKLDRFRPRFSPALQNPGRRQNARPDRLNMPCNPPAIPTANEQYPTQCDVVRRENESSPLPCNCHEKAPALRPGLCIPRRRSDGNRRAPIRAPPYHRLNPASAAAVPLNQAIRFSGCRTASASFIHSAAISLLMARSSRFFTEVTNAKQCAAYRVYSLCLLLFGMAMATPLPS